MKIFFNGRETDAAGAGTIADLVRRKGLNPDRVVVEHNLAVVAREAWESAALAEGDRLEIVTFVGGG